MATTNKMGDQFGKKDNFNEDLAQPKGKDAMKDFGTQSLKDDDRSVGTNFGIEGAKNDDAGLADKNVGEPSNVSNVKSFVAGKAKAAMESVGVNDWQGVKDKAGQLLDKAKTLSGDLGGRVSDGAGVAIEQVSTTVRRYPFPAILVGFGVGAVIGALLANNRRY